MSARRLTLTALASLCALAGLLTLSAASAPAALTHNYITQITGFGNPVALTVDSSSDVYVADRTGKTVSKFDASGVPVAFSASESYVQGGKLTGTPSGPFQEPEGVAVDNTSGHLYVSDGVTKTVDVFSSAGVYLFQFTGPPLGTRTFFKPAGLAVEQTKHELYVTNLEEGVVDVFSASGEYLSQFGQGVLSGGSQSVAVNEITETVYVSEFRRGVVDVFNESGTSLLPEWNGAGTPDGSFDRSDIGVGLDRSTGHVYVTFGKVDEFNASASEEYLGHVTSTPAGGLGAQAVAVDPVTGDLYVAGATGVVNVFGGDVLIAGASTGAASNVTRTTASLGGSVNPEGMPVTSCEFQYGTGTGFGQSVPCAQTPAQIGSGSGAVAVSAELSGLLAGTTYTYRLRVADANGVNDAETQSFTTPPAVDGVSTGPVEAVTASGAKLTGSLSPNGIDAHYYFEYGASTAYGSTSPAPPGVDAGSVAGSVQAETTLSGLAANSFYHYRLVALNSYGKTVGEDREFLTAGPPRVQNVLAEVNPAKKVGQTGATLQAQVNPGGRETTYRFEYGQTTAYGSSAPVPDGTILTGEEFVSVPAAEVSGLKVGTLYHYRILASNEYGTTTGPDQTFTTLPDLLLSNSAAAAVTATSATLNATINPLGSDTTYYFQYGTTDCTENPASCTNIPAPPGLDIGAGEEALAVSVHLQGLAADTTYHYRAVAINALGSVEGPDETFTTQAAGTESALPDGRAWEMVTPPDKQGAGITVPGREGGNDIQAAANGDGITFGATSPFVANPAGGVSLEVTQVLSTRHGGVGGPSWETADITTPHNEGQWEVAVGSQHEYKLFSSDLSLGAIEPADSAPLPPLPAGSEHTIYLRTATGGYEPLVTKANVPPGTKFGGSMGSGGVHFVSGTPDMSHIILSAKGNVSLSRGVYGGLYEWAAGQLKLVSVKPEGGQPANNSGALGGGHNEQVRHAISDDGSRVVWSGEGNLYMRDMEKGETIQLTGEEFHENGGGFVGGFVTASSDGSKVFFTENINRDTILNVFEVTSDKGQPLAGQVTHLTSTGTVQGVIGASEDGSYIYYVVNESLYVEHYDEGTRAWTPLFIAVLSPEDRRSWKGSDNGVTSRVSPNGRYLAFMSEKSLTGYENRDANSGVPDEEVFLYDAGTGHVVCASCNPTGARPAGSIDATGEIHSVLWDADHEWDKRWVAGEIPGSTPSGVTYPPLSQPRYLSDSGRLFFNSSDALVPADVNGKEDVYEYEPAGVGSCQPPGYGQSAGDVFVQGMGGCVALISAGTSSEESVFMDASEGGGDVFFMTLSRLASADVDTSMDVYDAHECLPSAPCAPASALVPPPCATGDACKAAPTPQPALFGEPSSETFSGAGNVVPAVPKPALKSKQPKKCKRGVVKKRGRCVKKKAKRSARGRK